MQHESELNLDVMTQYVEPFTVQYEYENHKVDIIYEKGYLCPVLFIINDE